MTGSPPAERGVRGASRADSAPNPAFGGVDEPGAAGLGVTGAVVRFGTTTALDDVCLHVPPGEVLALLGPSGCGKSTLLRAVAGLQPLDAGRVTWDGADLAGVPVHRRGFGLMFQDGQLFVHRDVGGNVAFGLAMAHAPREERRTRVAELLGLVGLAGYERRAVDTLSGGEQQRVALARALAPGPRLLLLDEPLSALDRALRERLSGDLAAILRRAGTTALYVTHDHDEAFAVADRIAVMSAGRLLQVDAPDRLWRSPASRAVAEFLGYEAFLPMADDDGAPALLAIAPGALRVAGPGTVKDAVDQVHRILHDRRLTGVVVAQRPRRGGVEVDVRVVGPARADRSVMSGGPGGPVVSAHDDGASDWPTGAAVTLVLEPGGAVVVPGARAERDGGYDRRP